MKNVKNNKGQIDGLAFILISLLIAAFFLVMGVIMLSSLKNKVSSDFTDTSDIILVNNGTATTLTYTPSTWTSATAKNQTWLDYDGVNDRVKVSAAEITSVSFWYKNSTVDWQHIVNASGTYYINGSVGTPLLFPIYNDGTDYYIGKIDAVTFAEVSVDDFRVYNYILNSSDATILYENGR